MNYFLGVCLIITSFVAFVNYEDKNYFENKKISITFYGTIYEKNKSQCKKLCDAYNMELVQTHYIQSHRRVFREVRCTCETSTDIAPGLTKVHQKEIILD